MGGYRLTTEGTLLNYLQAAWGLSSPLGTADLIFNEGWFNPHYPYTPQVTVTPFGAPAAEKKGTGGSVTIFYRPEWAVNVWVQIPVGSSGTAETSYAESMRKEVARVFRAGAPTWGGSISPLLLAIPKSDGIPHHEIDKTPRCLRWEIRLVGVKQNE